MIGILLPLPDYFLLGMTGQPQRECFIPLATDYQPDPPPVRAYRLAVMSIRPAL